jgi:hypothetical protein
MEAAGGLIEQHFSRLWMIDLRGWRHFIGLIHLRMSGN